MPSRKESYCSEEGKSPRCLSPESTIIGQGGHSMMYLINQASYGRCELTSPLRCSAFGNNSQENCYV